MRRRKFCGISSAFLASAIASDNLFFNDSLFNDIETTALIDASAPNELEKILSSYIGNLDPTLINEAEYLVYQGKHIPKQDEFKGKLRFRYVNKGDINYGSTYFEVSGHTRHYWHLRKGTSHFYVLNKNGYILDNSKITMPEFWFNLIDSIPGKLSNFFSGREKHLGIVQEITKEFEEKKTDIVVDTTYCTVYNQRYMLIRFSLLKDNRTFLEKIKTLNIKFQGAALFVNRQGCIDWTYLNINNKGDYCAIPKEIYEAHKGEEDEFRRVYDIINV